MGYQNVKMIALIKMLVKLKSNFGMFEIIGMCPLKLVLELFETSFFEMMEIIIFKYIHSVLQIIEI